LGPTCLLLNGVMSLRIKWPGCEANHSRHHAIQHR